MSLVTVQLQSQDDKIFELSRTNAEKSKLLKNLLEDTEEEKTTIPVPNIDSETLDIIIKYLENPDETSSYDSLEKDNLFKLILGANYLDIKELLDVTCHKAADRIRGKSVEEIKAFFE
jgi:S-phase kinase-associated protein 1